MLAKILLLAVGMSSLFPVHGSVFLSPAAGVDAGPSLPTGFDKDTGPSLPTSFRKDTGPNLPASFDRDHANMTTASMEDAVTSLLRGQSAYGATPMGGSVKTIQNVIDKTMKPKVKGAHESDQKNLNKLAADIARCGSTMKGDLRRADPAKREYAKRSRNHQSCRNQEAVKLASKQKCDSEERTLRSIKKLRCDVFAKTSKTLGAQKTNEAIVRKAASEDVQTYLTRMSGTICGRHVHGSRGGKSAKGGWGGGLPGSMLDMFLRDKHACEVARRNYNAKKRECKRKANDYRMKKSKCNTFQDMMDGNSCKAAVFTKDACERYAGCYYDKRKAYELNEAKVAQEETDRKAEWRGLKRIECLVDSFQDGKVTDKEIDKCRQKSHGTKHLTISYPKVPNLQGCNRPRLYPTTPAYLRKEFKPLPSLAKGKSAEPCSGIVPVSTKPRKGSPKGARCERMTLNGDYSAGALIKCTNGFDVRRSLQKNSCPRGTKIFSPASRSDWNTFLASAGALAAPHFIVDVTSPTNGCGKSCRRTMNSGVKSASKWQTSDGSPWWLRSKAFNEPNGDYHANCYMAIIGGTPKSENHVYFNDANCNYHSKSYYCQPKKIHIHPKPGSPKSCTCTKVELAGKYSMKVLVKCQHCLAVSRSTQKNSCPKGMKIFSPQSRSDWKTVLSSVRPVRNPTWIVDISRPQNGCGNCNKMSMWSGNPEQASWRTSDGSPWWLRKSGFYTNLGNFQANCYLGIVGNPANENSIKFSARGRKCHSAKSYLCQPIKKKVKRKKQAQPVPEPSPPVSFKYKGCYANKGKGRLGGHMVKRHLVGYTWNECKQVALHVKNKRFFGVEGPEGFPRRGQTWCLPLLGVPKLKRVADKECEGVRDGQGRRLGRAWRLAVYGASQPKAKAGWPKLPGHHCYKSRNKKKYGSKRSAQAACKRAGKKCMGIYDGSCDGKGRWYWCKAGGKLSKSKKSCVYNKP